MSSLLTATFMIISIVSPLLSVAVFGGQLASAKRLSRMPERPPAGRAPPRPARSPAAMEAGEAAPGAEEGEEARIFVRDVVRVALAGSIDLMCFDKTGTITKVRACTPPQAKSKFGKLFVRRPTRANQTPLPLTRYRPQPASPCPRPSLWAR